MSQHSIGSKIAHHRKLKGFTQNELSILSNITIRTIQRIEASKVQPQMHTLKAIANALEIPLSDLQDLKAPPNERNLKIWLVFIHCAALIGFIFPFSVLFPFLLWVYKKDDDPIYNDHGIKAVNFQLTMTFVYILAFISLITIKGFGFFFFVLAVPINIVIITFNIFKSFTSKKCYYPISYPFLK